MEFFAIVIARQRLRELGLVKTRGVDSSVAKGVELGMGMRIVTFFVGLMWRNHMDGSIWLYWQRET